MSDDELNKKIEFIVEHQAKFAAEMETMRGVQETDSRRLKDAMMSLLDIVGSMIRAQASADDHISQLAEAQKRTDEEINRLTQAQTETSQSLKILINVVERFISGNGGAESPA
jgi:hypothetical protein